MNGQLRLSAEQVIIAIQQLSPAEKRKVQRQLPSLFGIPEYGVFSGTGKEKISQKRKPQELQDFTFPEVRQLLSDISGSLSAEVIAEREDRV
ncbi:hypothetical protein GF340_02295 [Candidatus Peregrinibacteria bacterium]|nr:hypothetical protein [Candidatus Peregrinibacteria bacterium]